MSSQMTMRSTKQVAPKGLRQSGFSLIELLIVVAIILVIAAIAIPNLIRSRISANEAAAVSYCRTINTSNISYFTNYGIGFAPTLASLGGATGAPPTPAAAGLIDSVLAGGTKSGYTFTYTAGAMVGTIIPTYTVNADPVNRGSTGQRSFFTDQSGIIRFNTGAVAVAADLPIQ